MKTINISRISGNFTKQATKDNASALLEQSSAIVDWSPSTAQNALLVEYRQPMFQLHKAIADNLNQELIKKQVQQLAQVISAHKEVVKVATFALILTEPSADKNTKGITQNYLRVCALLSFVDILLVPSIASITDAKEKKAAYTALCNQASDACKAKTASFSVESVNSTLWSRVAPIITHKAYNKGICALITVPVVGDDKTATSFVPCTNFNYVHGTNGTFCLRSRGFSSSNTEKIHDLRFGGAVKEATKEAAKPTIKLRATEAANIAQVTAPTKKQAKQATAVVA